MIAELNRHSQTSHFDHLAAPAAAWTVMLFFFGYTIFSPTSAAGRYHGLHHVLPPGAKALP
jgi:hypothetical protein